MIKMLTIRRLAEAHLMLAAFCLVLSSPPHESTPEIEIKQKYREFDDKDAISYLTSRVQNQLQNASPSSDDQVRSSFRSKPSSHISPKLLIDSEPKRGSKNVFRIGLIVPRTAFLSQYKTYTQRIKDTFSHLLQLSRHQHQKSGALLNSQGSNPSSGSNPVSVAQQTIDSKPSTSSCSSNAYSANQQHKRLPWSNLTFNQFFDIKVVDLVHLAPRSSAQDITESMCNKLIEQNVSVIVYLENNQDQTVNSLDSQSSIPAQIPMIPARQTRLGSVSNEQARIESQQNSTNSQDTILAQIQSEAGGNKQQPAFPLRSSNRMPYASSQAHFIMHLAHSTGIPMIAWSMTATLAQRPKKQRTLHLAPTVAHEAEAMLAMLQRYSWYSFSVISTTLAGHDDFILALRQFMAAKSSLTGRSEENDFDRSTQPITQSSTTARPFSRGGSNNSKWNAEPGGGGGGISGTSSSSNSHHSRGYNGLDPEISSQPSRTFKLVDVITIKKRSLSHIEKRMRPLTASESRVILLYSTKGEAIDILRVAKKLKLTKRSYAWIVAQSVIGPNENERAPSEFYPGLLGIYFRSNHERLLDELSKAITIIAHGLERFVRDKDVSSSGLEKGSLVRDELGATDGRFEKGQSKMTNDQQHKLQFTQSNRTNFHKDGPNYTRSIESDNIVDRSGELNKIETSTIAAKQPDQSIEPTSSPISDRYLQTNPMRPPITDSVHSTTEYYQKLLGAYSKCNGHSDRLSGYRGDLLYEYFRKSSPHNVFDADGSLRDVELNVVNLDNERQWRKIGCFSDAKLTIDDITWPEQAERPPSGTMEKFHLRAVFLEEPSFVNLADPDAETGECKTNRAVRCRYKKSRISGKLDKARNNSASSSDDPKVLQTSPISDTSGQDLSANTNRSSHKRYQLSQNIPLSIGNIEGDDNEEFEYKCCSGFCIDLMEKFASDLKFSYDLYRVPDGLWGILENNTWNGLIGEITRGKADIIVSSTKINSDRQKAVEFTVPFLDTGISILVGKQTGVISKLAFLEPFDTLAWIMFICVGIPLAAISIFYFEWLSPGGFYAKNKTKRNHLATSSSHSANKKCDRSAKVRSGTREHQKFSFCRTLWLVVTILFGSAAHIDSPKGYTARFMSNVWASFAVVFLAVYTANLAAFMITREEYLEFSGISDSRLAYPYYRHPPLKFGTINGGNTHAVLSANKPNLYNYMRRYNRSTVEDGVDAVKSGQLDAFVYDALVLDYMASQDPECKLVNVGSWYSMTGYALAFPRNSRYYEKFNMKMLEYKKNGELDRLRRFWLQGLCKPGQNRHSISKPLDISQFMSAFLLLGAGILCSVLILVFEHLYIIYVRDRLIKSRSRKKFIKCLYPFSLSLTDTLRLPGDDENLDEDCYKLSREEPKDEESVPQRIYEQATFKKCGGLPQRANTSTDQLELKNLNEGIRKKRNDLDQMGTAGVRVATSGDAAQSTNGNGLLGYKRRLINESSSCMQIHLDIERTRLLESLRNYKNMVKKLHEKDKKLGVQRLQDERASESGDDLNIVESLANRLVLAIQNPSSVISVQADSTIHSPREDALASTSTNQSLESGTTQVLVDNLTEDDIREGYYGIHSDINPSHQSKKAKLIQASLPHSKKLLPSRSEQHELKRCSTTSNLRLTDQSDEKLRASHSLMFLSRPRWLSMDSNESKPAMHNPVSSATLNCRKTISSSLNTTGSTDLRSNSGANICFCEPLKSPRTRDCSLSPVNKQNCYKSLEGHEQKRLGKSDCGTKKRGQDERLSALYTGRKETLL